MMAIRAWGECDEKEVGKAEKGKGGKRKTLSTFADYYIFNCRDT
jgi:hypothetical protein